MESQWPYRVFGTMFASSRSSRSCCQRSGSTRLRRIRSRSAPRRSACGWRSARSSAQVSWLILKTGLVQLTIGVTLGLLGAWGVTSVLQSIMVQISPTDPVTFTAVTAILSLVTIAACLVPARRAMRLDPVKALNRT